MVDIWRETWRLFFENAAGLCLCCQYAYIYMYNKKVEESKIYDTWLIKVNAVLLLHFMHALSLRCIFDAFLILFFNAPQSSLK